MATDSSTQTETLPEIDEDDFVIITHQEANASRRPRFLNDISDYIDSVAEELWPINKKIHDRPELGYGEVIAHYTLTAYMKSQPGWTVTRSAYGMKTAWVAVYDTGRRGPCVSFNVEMGMSFHRQRVIQTQALPQFHNHRACPEQASPQHRHQHHVT